MKRYSKFSQSIDYEIEPDAVLMDCMDIVIISIPFMWVFFQTIHYQMYISTL